MVGKLNARMDKYYEFSPFDTQMETLSACNYLCCCGDSGSHCNIHRLFREQLDRDQIIKTINSENSCKTWLFRFGGFMLHFLSFYLILYPLILLVGMIPFFGAIGVTLLIFFAFGFALMSCLFILGVSWLFARPVTTVILFSGIVILFYLIKATKLYVDNNSIHAEDDPVAKFLFY
jgi:hypothetical protein